MAYKARRLVLHLSTTEGTAKLIRLPDERLVKLEAWVRGERAARGKRSRVTPYDRALVAVHTAARAEQHRRALAAALPAPEGPVRRPGCAIGLE